MELGVLYDTIYDGSTELEDLISDSQHIADFLEGEKPEEIEQWRLGSIGILYSDIIFATLTQSELTDSFVSAINSALTRLNKLDSLSESDRAIFINVISKITNHLKDRYPDVFPEVVQTLKDMPKPERRVNRICTSVS